MPNKEIYNREYFKYRLINADGSIYNLNCVEGASVDYDSTSELKQNATISVTQALYEELNLNSRIQIIYVKNDIETSIGTFYMATPSKTLGVDSKTYSIDCYSTLWLLSINKVTGRYLVPKGTQVVMQIRRIMEELDMPINITDSTASTSVDTEWAIGTSYLTIINDLLKVINYTSLYVDGEGIYTAKPYIEPSLRRVDFTYTEDDIDNILLPTCTINYDLFNVPNVYVRYVNNPNVEFKAVYENDNIQSPTSTAHRPKNVDVQEVQDIADIETLYAIAKRACTENTNKYSVVEFTTAINPNHLFDNCIALKLNTIDNKFIEKQWHIECTTGGSMTHASEEVVLI